MKTSIVIPCFNETNRFKKEQLLNFLQENTSYFFVLVNDGSTDKTLDLLLKIEAKNNDHVCVLNLEKNSGKANAVRLGILHAHSILDSDIIGYLDADFSTSLKEVKQLTSNFKNKELQFIFGSRFQKLDSNIKRKTHRHYLGRIFATVVSNMLNLKVYDTQCGAKFFKKDVIPILFNQPFITNWTFDVELFFRFKEANQSEKDLLKKSQEIPLNKWHDTSDSKVKFVDFLKAPFELLRIYFFYNKN